MFSSSAQYITFRSEIQNESPSDYDLSASLLLDILSDVSYDPPRTLDAVLTERTNILTPVLRMILLLKKITVLEEDPLTINWTAHKKKIRDDWICGISILWTLKFFLKKYLISWRIVHSANQNIQNNFIIFNKFFVWKQKKTKQSDIPSTVTFQTEKTSVAHVLKQHPISRKKSNHYKSEIEWKDSQRLPITKTNAGITNAKTRNPWIFNVIEVYRVNHMK